jgi:hypothetical protein
MYNVHESLLARMQDIEFVVFTEIYQRARRHLGTVGLGGNGQFVRLAALRSLQDSPWTDCLTEDLDLGIRLRLHGWTSEYTGRTWVEQQAVTSLARLIRQRARWFQGHLQCSRRIPVILRAGLPLHTTLDLCWHLLGPVTILLMSLWSALFMVSLVYLWVSDPAGSWHTITTQTWIVPGFYALSIAPAVLYGLVYRRQTQSMPGRRVAVLAHLFIIYGYLWFLAGWRAVWQAGTGRRGWAKTSRTAERRPAEAVALRFQSSTGSWRYRPTGRWSRHPWTGSRTRTPKDGRWCTSTESSSTAQARCSGGRWTTRWPTGDTGTGGSGCGWSSSRDGQQRCGSSSTVAREYEEYESTRGSYMSWPATSGTS